MRTEKARSVTLMLEQRLQKCHQGGDRTMLNGKNKLQICDVKIWVSIVLSKPLLKRKSILALQNYILPLNLHN